MVYDDESRLTSVSYSGGTDTSSYSVLGVRMRATMNGTPYRYVYNGNRVLERTNDAGATLARYATADESYFAPLLYFKHRDGTQHYPLSDIVGTSRRLVSETGAATDGYSLDAFGRYLGGWGNPTVNPFRYGAAWGYTTDTPGSGLLLLGARTYWPEVGRFLQQDPILDGVNWYTYAGDSPVTRVDPEGLWEAAADAYGGVGGGGFAGVYEGEWFIRGRLGLGLGGGVGVDPWASAPGYGQYRPCRGSLPALGTFGGISGEGKLAFGPLSVGYPLGRGYRWGGDTDGLAGYGEGRGWIKPRLSRNLWDYLKPWEWQFRAEGSVGLDWGAYVRPAPF